MQQEYKIILLYDNGRSYTIKNVYDHDLYAEDLVFEYRRYDNETHSDIFVTMDLLEVAAITIKKHDEVFVKKIKPCAVIRGYSYKNAGGE